MMDESVDVALLDEMLTPDGAVELVSYVETVEAEGSEPPFASAGREVAPAGPRTAGRPHRG
jgi:hypothetical protein